MKTVTRSVVTKGIGKKEGWVSRAEIFRAVELHYMIL